MFTLQSLEEAFCSIQENFSAALLAEQEPDWVELLQARGRVLAQDICATEYVPSFERSSVDGYALRAADTFGCSDSIPAILPIQGKIRMGQEPSFALAAGSCANIATGGALPSGADAVQMIEYTEDYGDGTVGILKPVAPQQHVIFKGDDVYPGKALFRAGLQISSKDIGALAALGITKVPVKKSLIVGIITTGDELVPIDQKPNNAQVRTVNTSLLASLVQDFGECYISYGIIKDNQNVLAATVAKACKECDVVLISGGSSVGLKDMTATVMAEQGKILFHGLAIKPGKPTIFGKISHVPVFGLPGHPVAVFFVMLKVVYYLFSWLTGKKVATNTVQAVLTESVQANDGRLQFVPVRLLSQNYNIMQAQPVRIKSGLITTLAGSHGYCIIPQNCEGYAQNTSVTIHLF